MSKRGHTKDEINKAKSLLGALISLVIIYWVFTYREFFGVSLTITFGLLFAFLVFTGILERKPFLPVYVIVASLTFRAGVSYFSLLENASGLADLAVSAGIVIFMLIVSFRAYSFNERKKKSSGQGERKSSKKKSTSKKSSKKSSGKTSKKTAKKTTKKTSKKRAKKSPEDKFGRG